MHAILLLFVVGFLSTVTANPISQHFGRSLLKRNNINKFGGCDARQQAIIKQAYKDTLRLADNIRPFLPFKDELFVSGVGPLEKRYFGDDIAASDDEKPALIRSRSMPFIMFTGLTDPNVCCSGHQQYSKLVRLARF